MLLFLYEEAIQGLPTCNAHKHDGWSSGCFTRASPILITSCGSVQGVSRVRGI